MLGRSSDVRSIDRVQELRLGAAFQANRRVALEPSDLGLQVLVGDLLLLQAVPRALYVLGVRASTGAGEMQRHGGAI